MTLFTRIVSGLILLSRRVYGATLSHWVAQRCTAHDRPPKYLLQAVLESASDVSVWAVNRDYRYLYFNTRHREITKSMGWADIGIGMSVLEVIDRMEFREFYRKEFDKVLAGNSTSVETQVEVLKDGDLTYEYYENRSSPIRNDEGEIVGVSVFTFNVTERKLVEDTLQRSEHLMRTVINATPDWIFIKDLEHRYQWVNQSYAKALHITPKDFIGRNDIDLGFSEELVKGHSGRGLRGFWADDRLAMDSNETQVYPDDQATIDGVVHTFLTTKVPFQDADGKTCGVIAYCRDNTEHKQAELAVEEARDRLKVLLQTIPDLVWLKNAEGVYQECNSSFERFFGAARADIVGKTDYDFVDAELADFFRAKDKEAIDCQRVCINEEWVTFAQDCHRVLLETRKVPLFDASGKVAGVLGIGRDITDRKRLEEQLQIKNVALDNTIEAAILFDDHPRIIMANQSACRLFGYSMEELLQKTVFDLQPSLTKDELNGIDSALISRGYLVLESISVRKNGLLFHCEATLTSFQYEGKKLVLLMLRDINERKLTECEQQDNLDKIMILNKDLEETARNLEEQAAVLEASKEHLQLTEAWYRGILQSAPDGMLVINESGIITLVNAQLDRMFGYSDGELIGQSIELLVPAGARSGHVAKRNGFVGGYSRGRRMAGEVADLRGCRKDGTEFAVDISLSRLPDVDGGMGAICAAIRDVTKQQRLELALAERERESRSLVENTPDSFARYNRGCFCIFANHALASSVKGGLDALLGKRLSEMPIGVQAEAYEAKVRDVFATGVNTEFELTWSDKNNREVRNHIRLTAEFDVSGAVATVLAVGRDITELHVSRQKIHQMAFYDTLTSLPNRALFNDRLRQMLTDAQWHEQQAGVMLLDLDRFKTINDTLGHPAGDALLRDAAVRLIGCVRGYDTVARLGGDEFAILLPDIRAGDDLGRIASKILEAFSESFVLESKEVFVSTSIGIAVYPDDSLGADELLKQADSAMYFAKRSGRNGFRFYSKDLTASSGERLALESELRRAVERKELELYYQPKIRLADKQLIGSEALLRWNNPQRGLVPPDQFISIAEDSGLIIDIGGWVLLDACRTACEWNGAGQPLHKVAINLSARQFQSNDLVKTVRDVLETTGCRTEWIELEITESLLLDEQGEVLDMLNAFCAMGISIAIDDFGTGYSSLSYLARFPINTLKIDRSFIRTVTTEHYRAELVKAILSIARCLGQEVVAEGVETPEQAAFLHTHGCQIAQGYFFGKPAPKSAASRGREPVNITR